MVKFRSVSWTLLLLIALGGTYAAGGESVGSSEGVLVYSVKSSSHPSSFLLKAPSGVTYRLSLIPEFDVRKDVVVLELVLRKLGETGDGSNLLDVTGKLHGYQPYFFAASDFAGGAQKSIYGNLRVIDLPRLGMEMRIKVAGVNVVPTSSSSSQGVGYKFDDLTLEIATQSLGR